MIKSILEDILNKWNTFYKGIINNNKRVRRKSAGSLLKFNIENQRQNKRTYKKNKENINPNKEFISPSKRPNKEFILPSKRSNRESSFLSKRPNKESSFLSKRSNRESSFLSKRLNEHFGNKEDSDNCILDVFNSLINEASIIQPDYKNEQLDINNEQVELNNKQVDITTECLDINNKQVDINNECLELNNEQVVINNEQQECKNEKNIKKNNFNQKISKQKKINKTKKRAVIMKNTKKKVKSAIVNDINEKLRVIKLGKRKSEALVPSEKTKEPNQVDKNCLTVKIVQALDEKENCKENKIKNKEEEKIESYKNYHEKQELYKDHYIKENKFDNNDLIKEYKSDKDNYTKNDNSGNILIEKGHLINNDKSGNILIEKEFDKDKLIKKESGKDNANKKESGKDNGNKKELDKDNANKKELDKDNMTKENKSDKNNLTKENKSDKNNITKENKSDRDNLIKKKNELLKNIFKKEKSKIENKKNNVLPKNSEFMTNTKIYKPEIRLFNEKTNEVKLQEKVDVSKNKIYDVKSSRFLKDNDLYKKVIDSQRKGVSQNEYKSSTVIPHIKSDEEDSLLFIEPLYSKDPELNDKVCKQDHKELERFFNLCEDINVAEIFPNIKDITNDSPNKWN